MVSEGETDGSGLWLAVGVLLGLVVSVVLEETLGVHDTLAVGVVDSLVLCEMLEVHDTLAVVVGEGEVLAPDVRETVVVGVTVDVTLDV